MEALEKAFHASALRELMEQYDSWKKAWIETNGTDAGFDTWFTKQVKKGWTRRSPKQSTIFKRRQHHV